MGPYYRATSQGTGAFFDMLYERPMLMLSLMVGALIVGLLLWQKSKAVRK